MLFKTKLIFAFLLIIFGGFLTANLSKVHADTFEEQVVNLINSERQNKGLSSLSYSDKLFQAAQNHNNIMFNCSKLYGLNSCFQHQVTLLNESTLMTRIKNSGYNPQSVAENIAWGYTNPASVVSGWMGSAGHRANILGNYKDIGCDFFDGLSGSYKGMYWTCDFGNSFGVITTTPTPTKNPIPTPTQFSTPIPTYSPSPTPRPIITNTPSPTDLPKLTPTPAIKPTGSIAPTPTIVPGSKAWWCKYAPGTIFCTS